MADYLQYPSGKVFNKTTLGSIGYSIGIRDWKKPIDRSDFVVESVQSTFDIAKYAIAHKPIIIDEVSDTERFSFVSDWPTGLKILDCPIKFPGSAEYRIPRELLQFDELIAKIASFEHSINPFTTQYYAYLTVDQGVIYKGKAHRARGKIRANGFQGARIHPKRPIARSYIAYDRVPQRFYCQSFKTAGLKESRDDFFAVFDRQADDRNGMEPDRYSIIACNAYSLHRDTYLPYDCFRTYFRLTFDTIKYDRLGNTVNPMFDYNWKWFVRDARATLNKCHETTLSC